MLNYLYVMIRPAQCFCFNFFCFLTNVRKSLTKDKEHAVQHKIPIKKLQVNAQTVKKIVHLQREG